uniref:oligosaccharide flippase family protein n=1 Tax=Aminiphilus circumscriptus TaxID=290732 RepID=UPI0004785B51
MFRSLMKDTFIYGGGDLVLRLVAFVSFPIIAAALSPKVFGALELLGTATALFGLFVNCGLNNAVQRFYWDKETASQDRPVVVSSGLVVLLFFGFLAGSFALVCVTPFFSEWVHEANLPMTTVAFVSAIGLMVFAQLLQYILDVLRLHFAPFRFLLLSFLHRVLGLALGLIAVVWLGKGVDGLLFVQMIVACAVLPFGLWLIRTDITLRFDLSWGRQLIVFGYPFIFAGLAYWLFGSIDR